MPGVRHQPTAAVSARTLEPEGVVCHVLQGYRSTMDAWASERPTAIHPVSYHFVIDTDGTPTQYVPISQRAWHAGRVPDEAAAAALWSLYKPGINPNDYTIGLGAEGMSESAWTPAQLASTITVLRWLRDEWSMEINSDTLIGHRDLDPVSRAHDPGPNWDRAWLLNHMTPAHERSDPETLPPSLAPFATEKWTEAWLRGAVPVRSDGDDHVYEIRVRRTE